MYFFWLNGFLSDGLCLRLGDDVIVVSIEITILSCMVQLRHIPHVHRKAVPRHTRHGLVFTHPVSCLPYNHSQLHLIDELVLFVRQLNQNMTSEDEIWRCYAVADPGFPRACANPGRALTWYLPKTARHAKKNCTERGSRASTTTM